MELVEKGMKVENGSAFLRGVNILKCYFGVLHVYDAAENHMSCGFYYGSQYPPKNRRVEEFIKWRQEAEKDETRPLFARILFH